MRDRLLRIGVAVGFVASAWGSALGSTPPWPNSGAWIVLAFLVAASAIGFAINPDPRFRPWVTMAVVIAGGARGLGYLLYSPTTAGKLAASGAWLLVIVTTISVHFARRKGDL